MTNPLLMYRFLLCFLLAFVLQFAKAQIFPTITPNNMDMVVETIYAYYGTEIQIQPAELIHFFNEIQQQYNEDLNVPDPAVLERGSDFMTFSIGPAGMSRRVGVLNAVTNEQQIDISNEGQYQFNGLNDKDLYVFAFAGTDAEGQSGISAWVSTLGYIIIIDEKIMYGRECDVLQQVSSGSNSTVVSLAPNSSDFFKFSISPCANPAQISDVFFLNMENLGNSINAKFFYDGQLPDNNDNFNIPSGNCIGSLNNPNVFGFRSIMNNNQFTHFEIRKMGQPAQCLQITVSRCIAAPGSFGIAEDLSEWGYNMTVHPNPTRDFAWIELEAKRNAPVQLTLLNSQGKNLQSFEYAADEQPDVQN